MWSVATRTYGRTLWRAGLGRSHFQKTNASFRRTNFRRDHRFSGLHHRMVTVSLTALALIGCTSAGPPPIPRPTIGDVTTNRDGASWGRVGSNWRRSIRQSEAIFIYENGGCGRKTSVSRQRLSDTNGFRKPERLGWIGSPGRICVQLLLDTKMAIGGDETGFVY